MSEKNNSCYISLGIYEYSPADVLGSGAFAIVYKGRFQGKPDKKVAIKQMIKGQNVLNSKTLLSKEIAVLKGLNHENIVRLYDHSISNSEVYLVMEFCNGGDLSEYLHLKKTLPEDTIKHFLIQIGSAMHEMNKRAIMHRDLKPGNILLSYYGEFTNINDVPGHLLIFKLADFGFARFLENGIMAKTMCGSPMYMAPEVLMCGEYDARADMWSMGVIVYQCFVGKAPFYANSPEALKNIYLKTVDLKPKIPRETSVYLRDLLLKMLIRKPKDRIDFSLFLAHPFLQLQHLLPSDLLPNQTATVPPLPNLVKRVSHTGNALPRSSNTFRPPYQVANKPQKTVPYNRMQGNPTVPLRHTTKPISKFNEPPISRIASLMPTIPQSSPSIPRSHRPLSAGGRGFRIVQTTSNRRPHGSHIPIAPLVQSPPKDYRFPEVEKTESLSAITAMKSSTSQSTDTSRESLTPTDQFIEDGIGGSSYLNKQEDNQIKPSNVFTTSGYAKLNSCLTDDLKNHDQEQLDGFVIIDYENQVPHIRDGHSNSNKPSRFAQQSNLPEIEPRDDTVQPIHSHLSSSNSKRRVNLQSENQLTNCVTAPNHDNSVLPITEDATKENIGTEHVTWVVSPELAEENLMEPVHLEEVNTITMVLELCELLTELAERRASALTDCKTTESRETYPEPHTTEDNTVSTIKKTPLKTLQHKSSKTLKLAPEAKRIVEQLVLYRRILYYLEYVFVQVKKAVANDLLKPTTVAKKRLSDCNALYHRCYIRLRQLARQSRREDLIEPIGRLLSRITANRLIFNYARDQCHAAELDNYMGKLGLCLQRYRAAITLIHGLYQHANTPSDKTWFSDFRRLIRDRYSYLWTFALNRPPNSTDYSIDFLHNTLGLINSKLASTGVYNPAAIQPPLDMLPGLGDETVAVGFHLAGAMLAGSAIPTAAITSALSSSPR